MMTSLSLVDLFHNFHCSLKIFVVQILSFWLICKRAAQKVQNTSSKLCPEACVYPDSWIRFFEKDSEILKLKF